MGHGAKQVEIAGRTMQELLSSVKEFSQIVGTIAAASSEQNADIEQINQIDGATQQNATLVDSMAASARSLESQASLLVQSVAERGRHAPGQDCASARMLGRVSRPSRSVVHCRCRQLQCGHGACFK